LVSIENQYGKIEISQEYFSNLVGKAASECFGVAGMAGTAAQGLRSAIAGRQTQDTGVRVRASGGGLVIDLHITVVYGVNISAIVKRYRVIFDKNNKMYKNWFVAKIREQS